MWKFSELPYERPDMEAKRTEMQAIIQRFREAESYAEAREAYLSYDTFMRKLWTLETIVMVRNTMDTTDAFYDAEMSFINREMAQCTPLIKAMTEAILSSPFRGEMEAEYGRELTSKLEIEVKTQSEQIVADLMAQSKLEEDYQRMVAACQTEFMGETVNFYGLLKQMQNPNRDTRRAAYLAWAKLYEEIAPTLDRQYDGLIALRVKMAKTLGFENFTELAYLQRGRADYGAKEVAAFREQVRTTIVPAVHRYRKAQAKRIGVEKLAYYDESFMFPDGNADPVGGEAELLDIAQKMYHALSPEAGAFIDEMLAHGLFDLTTRPGKHLGGYCTSLAEYALPFIFSNFNGTSGDVDVLTHEAGHAFAFYCSARSQPTLHRMGSTAEVHEIHSMTMEHFTYPWLADFYGEGNAKKAQYAHLCDALSSIPYLVCVDEFQHRVYEKPDMTARERRTVWREIEKTYMPWRDYDGVEFLEEGGFWMQKQHIFLYPFYYIDYALAQVCAFQFYGRMKKDRQAAWTDYLRLCNAGGSRSYFGLLELANLRSPFAEGTVAGATAHVMEELDAYQG